MNFPQQPFWDYSLELYRRPGVADACLFLQDRYGLNVNLVLFCVWTAFSGYGPLSRVQMATALRRVSDWQQQVVEPLRQIRRRLGREPLGIPEFLLQAYGPHIETAELEAEHVEQLVLADLLGTRSAAPTATAGQDARGNLATYIEALGVDGSDRLMEIMDSIVRIAGEAAATS